jgi:lipopolysaccharide transport system ATP-binding protein
VLAVGDESFQKKCIRWIESFLEQGNTLLMVSHSMFLVQKLCRKALWVHEGKARKMGDVFDVTQSYLAYHEEKSSVEKRARDARKGDSGLYQVKEFRVLGEPAGEELKIGHQEDLEAEIVYYSPDGRAPVALVGVLRADGTPVYGVASDFDGIEAEKLDGEHYRYTIRFTRLQLLPGNYSIRAHAMDPEGMRLCDTTEIRFRVSGQSREMGFIHLPHEWNR